MTKKEILKRFDKKFKDITHIGCPGFLNDIPCATVKDDIKNFISKTIDEIFEEIPLKEKDDEDNNYLAGYNAAVRRFQVYKNNFLNE